MRRRDTAPRDTLVKLRLIVPGALHVHLDTSSAYDGWRVAVEVDDEHAAKAKAAKWVKWPNGLSLGSGDTITQALDDARGNATKLRDLLLPPTCPNCGQPLAGDP